MDFAQSADSALKLIRDAAGASLVLILSDINMPGMTGLELSPKAKALRPDVPVIMVTAYGDADTRRKALEGGAEALLTKPIDFAVLRGEIDCRPVIDVHLSSDVRDGTTDLTAPKFDFRSSPKSGLKSDIGPCPVRAMCGRLRVGKRNLHVAGLVGAAMCPAF